jgi:hypothetical protein
MITLYFAVLKKAAEKKKKKKNRNTCRTKY